MIFPECGTIIASVLRKVYRLISFLPLEYYSSNSGLTSMDLFDVVPGDYGNIEEGVVGDDDEGVEIPQCEYQLLNDLEQLQLTVNPLQEFNNFNTSISSGTTMMFCLYVFNIFAGMIFH